MNWDAIGAIGEIIGAAAVFLTLVYLAMQIRQNTRAVQASAVDSAINQVNHIREAVFTNPEVTSMFRRGNEDPDSLSEDEKIRYRLLLHNALLAEANCHAQTIFTGLPISTWETQLPIVIRLLSSTGGKWFWKYHSMEFEESFRNIVDQELAGLDSQD